MSSDLQEAIPVQFVRFSQQRVERFTDALPVWRRRRHRERRHQLTQSNKKPRGQSDLAKAAPNDSRTVKPELSRVTNRLTDHIGNNSLHLMHLMQSNKGRQTGEESCGHSIKRLYMRWTSLQKCSHMARVVKGSNSFTCTLTYIGYPRTVYEPCLCLSSQSWSLFTTLAV